MTETRHLRARILTADNYRHATQRFEWADLDVVEDLEDVTAVEVTPLTSAASFRVVRAANGWEVFNEEGALIGLAAGKEVVFG